jgi:hypothetical protein
MKMKDKDVISRKAWFDVTNDIFKERFIVELREVVSYKRVLKLYNENKTPIEAVMIIQDENEDYLFMLLDLMDFDEAINGSLK